MRGVMLWAGVEMVQHFHAVILLFAAILLASAAKLFFESADAAAPEADLSSNCVMKLSTRLVGATDAYDGDRFFTRVDGHRRATPLLLCLVCIELSDFVFAVDSIPAVIGVSQDLVVVYSSNVFAILGLRSLYTLVAKAVADLPYLRPAVALVLAFVGLKMVAEYFGCRVPTSTSLAVVASLLGGGVLLSVAARRSKQRRRQASDKTEATDERRAAPSTAATAMAAAAGAAAVAAKAAAATAKAATPERRPRSGAPPRDSSTPRSSSSSSNSSSSNSSSNSSDRASARGEARRTAGTQPTSDRKSTWWPSREDFLAAFKSPHGSVANIADHP
jgi:predicted tellurium resistance membrane protein TerC